MKDKVQDKTTSVNLKTSQENCIYLLPCGICERTKQYCPVHYNWGGPTVIWTNATCNGDER